MTGVDAMRSIYYGGYFYQFSAAELRLMLYFSVAFLFLAAILYFAQKILK